MPRVRPPLPPKSGTAEDENYIANPELGQPVQPPQGDVRTGQPTGPAFTKLPRDAQRGAVNSTFDEMVANARATKSSVFDTTFDKALRFGAADAHGGVGVVTNPRAPLSRFTAAAFPRTYKYIDDAPGRVGLNIEKTPGYPGALGSTASTGPHSTVRINPEVWAKMLTKTARPNPTLAHELNHVIAALKSGGAEHSVGETSKRLPTLYQNAVLSELERGGADLRRFVRPYPKEERAMEGLTEAAGRNMTRQSARTGAWRRAQGAMNVQP